MLMGRIAVKWATLDDVLATALGTFIGNPEAGAALYFSSSSQQLRLDMLRAALFVSRDTEAYKAECLKHIDAIGDLWKRRNILIHNGVAESETRPGEYSSWVRQPLRKEPVKFLLLLTREMQSHIDALSESASHLMILTNPEAYRAFLASLDTQQQQQALRGSESAPQGPSQSPETGLGDPPQSSQA